MKRVYMLYFTFWK